MMILKFLLLANLFMDHIYISYDGELYIFNKDKPETFYFAHKDEFNKFINAYKEHKKVSEILEI